MNVFEDVGFQWDRCSVPKHVPTHTVARATFRMHKMLAEFVFDASMLEGYPVSYPEVQTLLAGITVGGKRVSEQTQVLNIIDGYRMLLAMVKGGMHQSPFSLCEPVFSRLHAVACSRLGPDWGQFRGAEQPQEGRHLQSQRVRGQPALQTPFAALGQSALYRPKATEPGAASLRQVFDAGVVSLHRACAPFERALVFFLFGSLHKFFYAGNTRTSRMMMNGLLMAHGMDAISVPAARAQEFNERLLDFYITKDATDMLALLVSCHPDFETDVGN